jgi:Endonuclease/Exonuclease/phosphatase family.
MKHGETVRELPTDRGPPDDDPCRKGEHPSGRGRTVILTYNCRGFQSGKLDVQHMLHKHLPHIAIITETRLHARQTTTKLAKSGFPSYHTWHSANVHKTGGVMLLIHHSLSLACKILEHPTPRGVQGFLLHHTISPRDGTEVNLFSVYTPVSDRRR